jgi:hypothetical protein
MIFMYMRIINHLSHPFACVCVCAGHLPDSLSKLSRLRVLYVSGNRLGGTITLFHHDNIIRLNLAHIVH